MHAHRGCPRNPTPNPAVLPTMIVANQFGNGASIRASSVAMLTPSRCGRSRRMRPSSCRMSRRRGPKALIPTARRPPKSSPGRRAGRSMTCASSVKRSRRIASVSRGCGQSRDRPTTPASRGYSAMLPINSGLARYAASCSATVACVLRWRGRDIRPTPAAPGRRARSAPLRELGLPGSLSLTWAVPFLAKVAAPCAFIGLTTVKMHLARANQWPSSAARGGSQGARGRQGPAGVVEISNSAKPSPRSRSKLGSSIR
jgi:hypothetical protein